ncbi:hypothetical protein EVAR_38446_1 [Eumeta japonica]|uniref:Uncharacterized protein n=1 Tax=Eumeta variegata TaxID=151549 RepID=A0A4C1X0G5_EUMVA|nr:hypothetical protein EVAR_38446_1 [Eumeta japonica]
MRGDARSGCFGPRTRETKPRRNVITARELTLRDAGPADARVVYMLDYFFDFLAEFLKIQFVFSTASSRRHIFAGKLSNSQRIRQREINVFP